jgi:hypothetical protein
MLDHCNCRYTFCNLQPERPPLLAVVLTATSNDHGSKRLCLNAVLIEKHNGARNRLLEASAAAA